MGWNRKRAYQVILSMLILLLILLISIGYLRYLDLKKSLLIKLSEKVTSGVGQKVLIEDLSLSLSGTVNLYNVTVKNPEDFPTGNLLRIKRIRLETDLRQFLKGIFHFRNISLVSPELTLLRNEKGRLNIPNVLTEPSQRPTVSYQVDQLIIESGLFDLNGDKRYRSEQVNLRVKNLSSNLEDPIGIHGTVLYAGNRVEVDGWASLQGIPPRVKFSISSKDFSPASFSKYLEPFPIDIEKVRTDIDLQVEGDAEKGFRMTSNIRAKGVPFLRFIKSPKGIHIRTDSMLNLREDSLVVNAMSLEVDGILLVTSKAVITGIKKKPSFHADIHIDNLVLSQLTLMKEMKVRGVLSSRDLRVTGDIEEKIRRVSGSFTLKEGGIQTTQGAVEKINGILHLSSDDQEISVRGEATAKVLKVGEFLLAKPVDTHLRATLSSRQGRLSLISSMAFSSLEPRLNSGKTISLEGGQLSIKGSIRGNAFSGKKSVELRGIRYGGQRLSWIKSASTIDYGQRGVTANRLTIETEEIRSSVSQLKVVIPEKENRYEVNVKEMDATYRYNRAKESRLKACDLSLTLYPEKDSLRGDYRLSAGNMMIQGMTFRHISGSGRFNEKIFSADIQGGEVFGGSIKLTASGRMSEDPFPIRMTASAERLDIGAISKVAAKWTKLPYSVVGDMKKATFEGTLNAVDVLHGVAAVEAGKISLSTGTGQNLIKEGFFHGKIELAGKDLLVKAEAGAGSLSMNISGTAKRFMEVDRNLQGKITLTEVKLTDIRNSFWDVFPDRLLYVGLEGSIAMEGSVNYSKNGLDFNGNVSLKNGGLQGENGEYSVRSINGNLPITYRKGEKEGPKVNVPSFERSQFDQWIKLYDQGQKDRGLHKITIQSFAYGFELLEDIQLFVEQKGLALNIERINANIFGGKLIGSAVIDLSNDLHYRAGFLMKGVSLKRACDSIEPIKGFISGKVDGIANLKGSGWSLSGLIGMVDFWTYPAKTERMVISKEFLEKIGGPSVKVYLGDRNFNKGIMSLYVKDGYLLFKELEISNRNIFGITDLSVKVAPLSNRIGLDHLLWTIAEAAERAKKK